MNGYINAIYNQYCTSISSHYTQVHFNLYNVHNNIKYLIHNCKKYSGCSLYIEMYLSILFTLGLFRGKSQRTFYNANIHFPFDDFIYYGLYFVHHAKKEKKKQILAATMNRMVSIQKVNALYATHAIPPNIKHTTTLENWRKYKSYFDKEQQKQMITFLTTAGQQILKVMVS